MICLSLAKISFEQCLAAMQDQSLVELRLDLLNLDQEITPFFKLPAKTIVTFRPSDSVTDTERSSKLIFAIKAGANYVDLELEAAPDYLAPIIKQARLQGCKVIISYHNFNETPSNQKLNEILTNCYNLGADVAKIACHINHLEDNARLLSLLTCKRPMVVVGMGELGKMTRVTAPLLGGLFTYASLADDVSTAPGQIDEANLKEIFKLLAKNGIGGHE